MERLRLGTDQTRSPLAVPRSAFGRFSSRGHVLPRPRGVRGGCDIEGFGLVTARPRGKVHHSGSEALNSFIFHGVEEWCHQERLLEARRCRLVSCSWPTASSRTSGQECTRLPLPFSWGTPASQPQVRCILGWKHPQNGAVGRGSSPGIRCFAFFFATRC